MPKLADPKSLVIWDLDNTLTDTAKFWGDATREAVGMTERFFRLTPETVRDAIRRAPGQYRFSDYGALLEWLDRTGVLPPPVDAAEAHDLTVTRWAIRDSWYRKQRAMTRFYPGAMETLRDIHANGTPQVIYTDTEASSLIRRWWLLSYNACRDGLVDDPMDVLGTIDHFYCQPSIEDDTTILKDVGTGFLLAFKQRMSILLPDPATGARVGKPSGPHVRLILRDFSTAPENAIMLGDSEKDGVSAKQGGIAFGWVHFGAVLDAETTSAGKAMADPGFQFGLAAMKNSFRKHSVRPDLTLRRSHRELLDKIDIAPGNPFNLDSAECGSEYPHTDGDQGSQNADPAIHRLGRSFHSRRPVSPQGPATHFPPARPKPGV